MSAFVRPAIKLPFVGITQNSFLGTRWRHCTDTSSRRVPTKVPARMSAHIDRRQFMQFATTGFVAPLLLHPVLVTSATIDDYSIYKGPMSLGYSFAYPSSWKVKKKPIRTHLSEVIVTNAEESSISAGVVVDNVKINSIEAFGTPESVGRKVVDVEMRKENVNNASVSSAKSIQEGGLVYYIVDYTVDSSRGVKRYIAKVTVNEKQLYVFTVQAKSQSFDKDIESVFYKMLDSFTVLKQFLNE